MGDWFYTIKNFLMIIGAIGVTLFIALYITCWIIGIAEDKKYNGKPPKL